MSFPRVVTDGGDWALIYTVEGKGEQPVHGAYWTGEEWMPTSWTPQGFRMTSETPSKLNITRAVKDGLLPKKEKEAERAV